MLSHYRYVMMQVFLFLLQIAQDAPHQYFPQRTLEQSVPRLNQG